jgi:two-component system, chemotaxis family, response regulator WspR
MTIKFTTVPTMSERTLMQESVLADPPLAVTVPPTMTNASRAAAGAEPLVLVVGEAASGAPIHRRLAHTQGLRVSVCPDPGRAVAMAVELAASVVLLVGPAATPAGAAGDAAEAGWPVLTRLRAHPATADLPLVLVGAGAERDERRAVFAAGASDCWPDLPEPVELVARLRALSRGPVAERARDAALAALERASATDPATGVASRARLAEFLEAEWRRARRSGSPVSVVLVEIAGAALEPGSDRLPAMAAALRGALRRGGDVLARCDHRRFVAVLPEVGADGARTVGRTLVEAARRVDPGAVAAVGTASLRPKELASSGPAALLAQAEASLKSPS